MADFAAGRLVARAHGLGLRLLQWPHWLRAAWLRLPRLRVATAGATGTSRAWLLAPAFLAALIGVPPAGGSRSHRRAFHAGSAPPGADGAGPLRGEYRFPGSRRCGALRAGRRDHGVVYHGIRVSRATCPELAVDPAVGAAHLHRRHRLRRCIRLRGAGSTAVSARPLDPRGQLSDPRPADLRRALLRADRYRVPLCLPDVARRVRAPECGGPGDRSQPRLLGTAGVASRGAAAGPPGSRRRHGAGGDGDAGRIRCDALLRRRYADHRHLPRLVSRWAACTPP